MEKDRKEIDIWALAKVVWSQKRKLIKWGSIGICMGIVVAFSIPKEFQAKTKLVSELKSKTSSLGSMGALAGMAGINLGTTATDGISDDIYPDIVASNTFLMELASMNVQYNGQQMTLADYLLNHQKYAWWSYVLGTPAQLINWAFSDSEKKDPLTVYNDDAMRQDFVRVLSSKLSVEKDKKTNLILISVTLQSRPIAQQLTDSLSVKIEQYMVNYRTDKARRNLTNTIKMSEEAKAKYYIADKEYAEALDRNQNLISQVAKTRLTRLHNEQQLAFSIYQELAMQVESSRIKIQEDTPVLTVVDPTVASVRAIAPKKLTIIIFWGFLAVVSAAASIVIKQLKKVSYDNLNSSQLTIPVI